MPMSMEWQITSVNACSTLGRLLCMSAMACALYGCTTPRYASLSSYEFPKESVNAVCNSGIRSQQLITFAAEEVCLRQKTPEVGVALSGGGSKSAPFALGVLAGLQETGVLPHVDIISSVSGGSYAALYFYSRLLAGYNDNAIKPYDTAQIFLDCLPENRAANFAADQRDWLPRWSATSPSGLCPKSNDLALGSLSFIGRYWPLDMSANALDYSDPLRQASHTRGYANVLDSGWSYDNNVDAFAERLKVGEQVTKLVGINSLLLGIPNFIANSLFDWRISMSWTKGTYDQGITRTYARDATELSDPKFLKRVRPDGMAESVARLRFSELRGLYNYQSSSDCAAPTANALVCKAPFWIINATAGTSRTSLRLVNFGDDAYYARRNGFEFTAYGYGSGAFGWFNWGERELEPLVTLPQAVGISSAFLDSQQRQVGGAFRPLVNLALHTFNLDWGTDIANYQRSAEEFRTQTTIHNFLPWPFYLLHRQTADASSLYIHVSDGGQNENLGVAALLRRHVRDIIVADGGQDIRYALDDLCELGKQLEKESDQRLLVKFGHDLYFLGERERKCKGGKDPFKLRDALPEPIIRGWVCKKSVSFCSDTTAESRLYIIKAALRLNEAPPAGITLAQAVEYAKGNEPKLTYEQCAATGAKIDPGYPCEVVTYLANPSTHNFPQDSTATVTLSSNAYIFGAYKELGRYYASHLSFELTGNGVPIQVRQPWPTTIQTTKE
jgi:Patatin-like phospholipase